MHLIMKLVCPDHMLWGANQAWVPAMRQHCAHCRALDMVSGIQGTRMDGMTGVWVNEQKIAAIGVRAKSWVTYHGLALNVAMNLQPFQAITPCGLQGRTTTSVQLIDAHSNGTKPEMLMQEYAEALLEGFAEVFDVHLEPAAYELSLTHEHIAAPTVSC